MIVIFSLQTGRNYISTLARPYNITSLDTGTSINVVNHHLAKFANEHKINIVKAFNVPTTENVPRTKFYVLGSTRKFSESLISKQSIASKQEFETSDLRYPLYFFGNISSTAVAKELHRLGLHYKRDSGNWNTIIYNFLSDNYFAVFLILLLLILLVVLIVANFKRLRASNIAYLEGVSKFQDTWKYFIHDQIVFLITFIPGFLIVLITMISYRVMGVMPLTVYFAVLLIFAEILVSVFAFLFHMASHSINSLQNSIKGDGKSTLILVTSICFKVVTELSIIVTLMLLLGQFAINSRMEKQLSNWQHLGNYYTPYFSPYALLDNEQDQEDKAAYQLVNWSEKHKGIIASYGAYESTGKTSNDYDDVDFGNVLIVNAEYLKKNKILTASGHRLSIAAQSENSYFLFPEKLKSQSDRLSKNYFDQLPMAQISKLYGRELNYKKIMIKNGQRAFTYNTEGIDFGFYDGYVKEPVILVLSTVSLGGDNEDADHYWDSLISKQGLVVSNYHALAEQAQKRHISRQIGGYLNIRSHALQAYQQVRQHLILLLSVLAILILMLFVNYILVNQIYFANYERKIAIRRLSGRYLARIHFLFTLVCLSVTVLEGMFAASIYNGYNNRALISGVIASMTIFQLLLLIIQALRADHRISQAIKGED
ncbi:hypothetical protein [Oenococcus oeni]|uniref:hypothetical protein n=1 Tax=Oenococcus oeni TaxID=1247 RepID=UPI0021B3FBF1|nr:hypothetical protein [Oenococcus oeni]